MLARNFTRRPKRVAMIEPVFGNVPSMLRREGVDVVAIAERDCTAEALKPAFAKVAPEVVWLVMPNDPTGWTPTEEDFRALVGYCAAAGLTLVLDMSLRFLSPELAAWSQYDILESADISYVVIADSRRHRPDTVTDDVRENRRILRDSLADAPLEFLTAPDSPVPVDWIGLPDWLDSETVTEAAASQGVDILPGTNFYWNNPALGHRRIRVPLTGDPHLISCGALVIRDVARRLSFSSLIARCMR